MFKFKKKLDLILFIYECFYESRKNLVVKKKDG